MILVVDPEGQAPVARDVKTPSAFPVSGHLMCTPMRDRAEFVGIFHVLNERQHLSELVHRVSRNAFLVIFMVQALKSLMGKVPYLHV